MIHNNNQAQPVIYNGIWMRNFTPHPFNLYSQDNELLVSVPSEGDIRAPENIIGNFIGKGGIPTTVKEYLPISPTDLPTDFDPSTQLIILSSISLAAYQGDVKGIRCPDSGPNSVVRDEKGRILGVRGLQAKG